MKFSQKLEVVFGVLFSISLVPYMYFIDYPSLKWLAEDRNDLDWSYWSGNAFLVLLVPLVVFPLFSYLHAAKHSLIAMVFILIIGGIFALTTFLDFSLGHAFRGLVWIGVAPGILAFVAMLLAIVNTILYRKNSTAP